ncbi:MAG: ribosome biogenesis GTPase YlqF [Lachnospiraceae bacterium]|nr:ribosome biogenesis GTPase YlqF [Lachnospiraceae bacterium]
MLPDKISWYPGHMTKAMRAMQEDIKKVDLVIELLDARIPLSSENPDIDRLAANKFRMVLLNKADLADEEETRSWIRYFENKGIAAFGLDSRNTRKLNEIRSRIPEICRKKLERDLSRGIMNRPIRAMVAGIPNVGKSTFINSFAGKAAAKTGNKPGVTRGNQWIRLSKDTELLDTPGVLWPKFDDPAVGLHLSYIGAISDDVIDRELLAYEFLKETRLLFPGRISDILDIKDDEDANVLIERIAMKRNLLKKGAEPDRVRASAAIIDDFRNGKYGRLTLERAEG